MRVCLFTDTLGDLNGVSRFIQDMCEQALSHDFDLQIVTATAKECPVLPNIHNLKPAWRVPMPFYSELDLAFPSAKALERKLLELRPDIMHISTPGPVGFLAKKLAKRHRIPTLGTYHTDFPAYLKKNTGFESAKKITDRVMAGFYRPFERVFTRSRQYLDIMERDIGIPNDRSLFLSPGTNLHRFNPAHRDPEVFAQYGALSDGPKVLYVGRISKEKNIPFLLEVWESLKNLYGDDDAELILVGEGALRHKRRYNLIDDVIFTGPVIGDDLSRLYASSDLFVFPSVTDTLGQVVMEAQASGICAVVSDQGGPQSIINAGTAPGGLVLKGNDTQTWVDTLHELLENATLRQHYARQGIENMRRFDIIDSFTDFSKAHLDVWQQLRS